MKIQPERGTAPVAYGLLEALYQDAAPNLAARVLLWVVRNTYGRRAPRGPRRKACAFSWSKIARDLGEDRSDVSKAGRRLLASGRLRLDAHGHIGLQTDPAAWKAWRKLSTGGKLPGGKSPVVNPPAHRGEFPPPTGGNLPGRPNAREVLAVNPIRTILTERPLGRPVGKPPTGPQRQTAAREAALLALPYPVRGEYHGLPIQDLPADYCGWALEHLSKIGPNLRAALQLRAAQKDGESADMSKRPSMRRLGEK